MSKSLQTLLEDITFGANETYFSESLKDGATIQMTGDYSGGGATDFLFTTSNDNTHVARVIVFVTDASFRNDRYGASIALTNGIKFFVDRGVGKVYLHEDTPIKTIGEYSQICYDVIEHDFGVGQPSISVRWSFNKGTSRGIRLDSSESFGVELDDDFTSLTSHSMIVQGAVLT